MVQNKPLTQSQRRRSYSGPALLARPQNLFFLLAALWAALAMGLWGAHLAFGFVLPSRFDPSLWHQHEMLFGYLSAVMAGYLLGAFPNWTGRLPVMGMPLAILAGLWVAGRAVVLVSDHLPMASAALIDAAFPIAMVALLGREVWVGRAVRNLPVLGAFATFALANVWFHVTEAGVSVVIAVPVLMITLVGGRMVPSFTRHALSQSRVSVRPAPYNGFDRWVLGVTGAALLAWVLIPGHLLSILLSVGAAVMNVIRLLRWQGWAVRRDPVIVGLHLGYGFIPLGFLALAIEPNLPMNQSAVLHLWLTGAIGLTTASVMMRLILTHAKHHRPGAGVICTALLLSVLLRLMEGFVQAPNWLLWGAAGFWIAGFGLLALWIRRHTAP